MKNSSILGKVMHIVESKERSSSDKLAELVSWAKQPELMNEYLGYSVVEDTRHMYMMYALVDQTAHLMGHHPQYAKDVELVFNTFFSTSWVPPLLRGAPITAPEYHTFLAFLQNVDARLWHTSRRPKMQTQHQTANVSPLTGSCAVMLTGNDTEHRQPADVRPVPWPWSSMLSAITLILENTSDPAILMEIDAHLGSGDPKDGQALLDYFTAKGVTLPALQSNSHLPDNIIHGNAVAVVTRQYERYHTPERRVNTEYSMLREVLERLLAFVKVNAAPVEIEPSPRYSVTDALIVLLKNSRGVDILPMLDNFLQNCSYFDAPELMKLFASEGCNLPGLETVDAIPVGDRETVKELLLRERCAAGFASPSIVVANAARNISSMLSSTGDVAESEQMVLNRIKHHPSVFAEPPQVSIPLPEYVRKTALDLFEQNLLRGCVLIAQYTDIAAGMNLSEEQTEILTKNLRGRYSGSGWPKCYDHTMLVDGAGSAYDQALMLAVCGTAATVDGLQLLQENGHVISQAIEFMENPVCRASVLRLVRVPNAIIGEFNY